MGIVIDDESDQSGHVRISVGKVGWIIHSLRNLLKWTYNNHLFVTAHSGIIVTTLEDVDFWLILASAERKDIACKYANCMNAFGEQGM